MSLAITVASDRLKINVDESDHILISYYQHKNNHDSLWTI